MIKCNTMSEIVTAGASIEGLSVNGYSRNPLNYKGLVRHNNIVCHRFSATFDVKSQIDKRIIKKNDLIEKDARLNVNDTIICENAIVHSFKSRYTKSLPSNFSAKHGTNGWHFPSQTNVKIIRSHQEIQNALKNRAISNSN